MNINIFRATRSKIRKALSDFHPEQWNTEEFQGIDRDTYVMHCISYNLLSDGNEHIFFLQR